MSGVEDNEVRRVAADNAKKWRGTIEILADAEAISQRFMDYDPADDMCPNCVTPWKCNGPHVEPERIVNVDQEARKAASVYDEVHAAVVAEPVGSLARRLHSALGDLSSAVLHAAKSETMRRDDLLGDA